MPKTVRTRLDGNRIRPDAQADWHYEDIIRNERDAQFEKARELILCRVLPVASALHPVAPTVFSHSAIPGSTPRPKTLCRDMGENGGAAGPPLIHIKLAALLAAGVIGSMQKEIPIN